MLDQKLLPSESSGPDDGSWELGAFPPAARFVSQLTSQLRARLSGTRHSVPKLRGDRATDLSAASTKASHACPPADRCTPFAVETRQQPLLPTYVFHAKGLDAMPVRLQAQPPKA